MNPTIPTDITLHQDTRLLEIAYADGQTFTLSCELLRVYSPSAEVQGHGKGQEVLQTGKSTVTISAIEAVGNYGIKPHFSDGHNTGIFDWKLLYEMGTHQDELWQNYLERIAAAGLSREVDASAQTLSVAPAASSGCGSGNCSKH